MRLAVTIATVLAVAAAACTSRGGDAGAKGGEGEASGGEGEGEGEPTPTSATDAVRLGLEPTCAGCHGEQGRGGEKVGAINSPALLALLSDQILRRYIITGRPDPDRPDLSMPGYGPAVPDGAYFVIGPAKQLDAYQDYLRAAVGKDAVLHRLYPRDFWVPAKL